MQDHEEMPDEVLTATRAYEEEYSKIKDKVIANKEKYKGTKYEDCPPLLEEQMKFFVRKVESDAERKRLKKSYGRCPLNWAICVTWYKKQFVK